MRPLQTEGRKAPVTLETGDLVSYRDHTVMSPGQRDVVKSINVLKDLGSKRVGADRSLEEPSTG